MSDVWPSGFARGIIAQCHRREAVYPADALRCHGTPKVWAASATAAGLPDKAPADDG